MVGPRKCARVVMEPLDYGIGYSSRGCIRDCDFCPVPRKEGHPVVDVATIGDLLNPRAPGKLVLLDNNFFASPTWRDKVAEILRRRVRVDFEQGVDIRLIDAHPDQARALGELYREKLLSSDGFTENRLHFAWDMPSTWEDKPLRGRYCFDSSEGQRLAREHADQIRRAVGLLFAEGFDDRDLMCFVLTAYPGYEPEEELFRLHTLMSMGIHPYVMRWRDLDSTRYDFDQTRSNMRQWVNGHAWRTTRFEDYRPELTHGKAARVRESLPLLA
jgi:hypothetical protein